MDDVTAALRCAGGSGGAAYHRVGSDDGYTSADAISNA